MAEHSKGSCGTCTYYRPGDTQWGRCNCPCVSSGGLGGYRPDRACDCKHYKRDLEYAFRWRADLAGRSNEAEE